MRKPRRCTASALDAFDRAGEGGSLDRALTLENIAVMLRAQGALRGERKAPSGSAAAGSRN